MKCPNCCFDNEQQWNKFKQWNKIKYSVNNSSKDFVGSNPNAMISGDQLQIQINDTKKWKPVSGAKII